ncbi:hypothetical protein GWN26_11085, partial [Candidatus Saccharibacteria bacterium]|nr:hypothetical protein [Candidatus Saccharibacteria bacterium]NIV04122.1 hypothetical protein [Calditrichia bacterium]NIS38674.1 hypothetical protein [Candidatus Saccharibacteria bacterium]NIV72521.1 hypothetical protein [Calditrichia bacterium]NIV99631.1 hypothetical protein [Candidatus Saccharibacteria bacterium]
MAAKRGIDMAMTHGLNVSMIILKDAKDPDDLINKDAELWKRAIADRVDVMTYYFDQAKEKYNLQDAQGKKEAAKFLLAEIPKLTDKVEQTHWLQELAKLIDVNEQVLRESMPQPKGGVKSSQPKPVLDKQPSGPTQEVQAWSKLISILINRPEL